MKASVRVQKMERGMLTTALAIILSTIASFITRLGMTPRWGPMSRIATRSAGLIFEATIRASIAVSQCSLWSSASYDGAGDHRAADTISHRFPGRRS
jgi:hypothetical protein